MKMNLNTKKSYKDTTFFYYLLIILIFFYSNLHCQKKLNILFYNVENLFDAEHDEGNNDWSFLPASYPGKKTGCDEVKIEYFRKLCYAADWNPEKVKIKLNQISRVISLAYPSSRPDLIGLVEIENKKILKSLAKKIEYDYIVYPSPDKRGVRPALLYKEKSWFQLKNSRTHAILNKEGEKINTRDILEVQFKVENKYNLYVFVNHWPSQHNPVENRILAAETLMKRLKELYSKNSENNHVLIMGDFNTIDHDKPYPFDTILKPITSGVRLKDIHGLFTGSEHVPDSLKKALPKGTYFYRKKSEWSRLDRFFISSNLVDKSNLDVNLSSYEIFHKNDLGKYVEKYTEIIPNRYNFDTLNSTEAGYSDHYPIKLSMIIY
jgi:hypothetical protein